MIYLCVCACWGHKKKITGDLVRNWKLCLRNEKEVVFQRRHHQRKQMLRNKTENHVRGNVLLLALACLGGFQLTSFTIVHRTRTYTEIKEEVASCVGSPPNVRLSDRFSKQKPPYRDRHHPLVHKAPLNFLLHLSPALLVFTSLHVHLQFVFYIDIFRYVHLWFHPQMKRLTQLAMTQGSGPQQVVTRWSYEVSTHLTLLILKRSK